MLIFASGALLRAPSWHILTVFLKRASKLTFSMNSLTLEIKNQSFPPLYTIFKALFIHKNQIRLYLPHWTIKLLKLETVLGSQIQMLAESGR